MRFDNILFGGNSQNAFITPILNNASIEIWFNQKQYMKLLYYLPQVYLLNKSRAFWTCWWLPSWGTASWSLYWWRTTTWLGILVPLKMWVVIKYESYYGGYCTMFCKLILKHPNIIDPRIFFFESGKCGNFSCIFHIMAIFYLINWIVTTETIYFDY